MKANGAIRIPTVACRISPKRTLTRILTMQKQSRNLESRNNFSFLRSPFLFSQFLLSALFFVSVLPSFAQTNLVTPAQYLQLQQKPNFAAGHHLPHLTQWGWGLSSNATVECALNWGYTLGLGDADSNTVVQIKTANSTKWKFIQLAKNDPTHYALSVNITRNMPTNLSAGFWVTNSDGYFVDDNTNLWLGITNKIHTKVVSPEASDVDLTNETVFHTVPISAIVSNAPIAIILNGGERDLNEPAGDQIAWGFDPRVIVARGTNTWSKYISQQKGHQLGILASVVRAATTNHGLYIFYKTSNEQLRITALGNAGQGAGGQDNVNSWWNTYDIWSWWSSYLMGTNVTGVGLGSDMPSFEDYFIGSQSWTNIGGIPNGYSFDLLTMHLNAVGYNFELGYTNNYSWLCGGWSNRDANTNKLASIPRYTGFLKCLYTAGMVAGVAGYFVYPTGTNGPLFGGPGFDASFPSNSPPHWLQQITALSHVHALFSHLDNFLYNGDLLSGPQHHAMSYDQPAYEFTNTVADATARVLARKLRSDNQWLVTAWAADGTNRNVTVNIPTIGDLTVLAANSGSVYQVTMTGTNVQQTLLDEYGPFSLVPPKNLRVLAK